MFRSSPFTKWTGRLFNLRKSSAKIGRFLRTVRSTKALPGCVHQVLGLLLPASIKGRRDCFLGSMQQSNLSGREVYEEGSGRCVCVCLCAMGSHKQGGVTCGWHSSTMGLFGMEGKQLEGQQQGRRTFGSEGPFHCFTTNSRKWLENFC